MTVNIMSYTSIVLTNILINYAIVDFAELQSFYGLRWIKFYLG